MSISSNYIKKFKIQFNLVTFLILTLQMGSCAKEPNLPAGEIHSVQTPVDGIRIAWDYRSLTKIAPLDSRTGYFGYARMIQLFDGRLACVYETSTGNIELVFSTNLGESWGNKQIVFETKNNIAMAVPEIVELSDHSVLVACNPRPREPYTEDRRFGIKVRKSMDGGLTWEKEQIIYQAQSTFENGCWEPSMIQLPGGEVQLFFANEGIYTTSSEQNISMFRSADLGNSWTGEPEIIGFRKDRRDGMPVPLLLKEKGELLITVEDNKIGEFKPTVYREKLAGIWSDGTILAADPRREYAPFTVPLAENIYAGAPYLERLQSGEVILSYQTNLQRDISWNKSAMMVEISDENGRNFSRRSVPFAMPLSKSGLWNSMCVIGGNTLVAITSTDAFSSTSTEVWMIKGHVIPEFHIPVGTALTDGSLNDACWQNEWPYFVGHTSRKQLVATLCKDEKNLYVAVKIDGLTSDDLNKTADEFFFLLDTERKSYKAPYTGIFAFRVKSDGSVTMQLGLNGLWIQDKSGAQIKVGQSLKGSLHIVELAIPLSILPEGFGQNKTVGINFVLQTTVAEPITSTIQDQPFTWTRAFLP
ncbi:MAG: exo-alpha-sialidase [Bacteroidetes bacterium]|nr:exo-alpha-sialidase [Bacteroidota bacterium]MCL6102149.1 exo-alpha-sialidase [Bacteroidota bacterium]